jgi:hypothetical protein
MRTVAQLPILTVAPRAVLAWVLIRMALAVIPLAGGGSFGSMPPWPVGVVCLSAAVGLIDVHVRGERILWANLGVRLTDLGAIYAAAAAIGEITLSVISG